MIEAVILKIDFFNRPDRFMGVFAYSTKPMNISTGLRNPKPLSGLGIFIKSRTGYEVLTNYSYNLAIALHHQGQKNQKID